MSRSKLLQKASSSSGYLWSGSVFVIMSLVSSAINYVYYPFIAHFLTASEFGATQSLLAILLQIGAVFSGLNLVTIFLVHQLSKDQSKQAVATLQRITTSLFLVLTIVITIAQASVMHFLHINSRAALMIISLDLLTSIPFIISFGYLQAQKRFIAAGFLQLSVVSLKLMLGVLATVRFGVLGALAGITLGQIAGMVVFWLGCHWQGVTAWEHDILRSLSPPGRAELRRISKYGRSITSLFVVNIILSLCISFDILAARHYLSSSLSGLYSGASTLSNAIVFVCLPIIGVLLPQLHPTSFRKGLTKIKTAVGAILVVTVISELAFLVAPRLLLGIFGSSYTVMAPLLWKLGILMSAVALLSLSFQISGLYRPLRTAVLSVLSLAALMVSVSYRHQSPEQLVSTIMLVFGIMLIISTSHLYWIYTHDQN